MDLTQRLPLSVYFSNPLEAAKNVLLGAYLCADTGEGLTVGKITELEFYGGATDRASHAYQNKRTPRTEVMFQEGGRAYIYLIYGMYHQLNIVLGPAGTAETVLVRSVEPLIGQDLMQRRRRTTDLKNLTTGPAKVCQAFGLTKAQNGETLSGKTLWISPSDSSAPFSATSRIGIDYAGEDRYKPWRFYLSDNSYVSHLPKNQK